MIEGRQKTRQATKPHTTEPRVNAAQRRAAARDEAGSCAEGTRGASTKEEDCRQE